MLKLVKRGLHICIALAIILTTMPLRMVLPTQAASEERIVDAISFKEEIGFYAHGGNVYKVDKDTQISEKIDVSVEHVVSLAYDGSVLYLVSEDMTITAYNIETNETKWTNKELKNGENTLGSAIFLDKSILYINATKDGDTTLLQLKSIDGSVVKTVSNGYRDVKGSLPYVSEDKVVFSSKDLLLVNQSSERFVKLYDEDFVSSVYDATSKQVFALTSDGALYVSSLDNGKTYITLYKTVQNFASEQIKATIVDNTPLLISLKDSSLVLYFYDGVSFVKQDTGLTCSSIDNIAFDKGNVYVVDGDNKIQSASYTVPTKKVMDVQAAQLQTEILTVYDSISQKISNLTLEKKETIENLLIRYQALSEDKQSQVLSSSVLSDMNTQMKTLQKNVDDINQEIKLLSSPEEFKKIDTQKVLAIEVKYKALKAYDKTLIDQKLFRILDKIKAFDVEAEIATLPSYADITVKDLPRVQEVALHYDGLASEWKKDVTSYAYLQRLENRIYELMSSNTLGDAYWSNFGGNKTSSAITNTKTPYEVEDVQSNFTVTGNYQESIIVDNHIYTIRDKNYLTILDNKGNTIAETKLYSKIGFFSRLAYGDGKIYVPLNNCIQAFDAKTLRPLWVSQQGNQFISTVTYHNGYIYSGMTTGGGGDKGKTNGYFFAINVKDEDTNNSFEVKDFAWTCGETKNTGYYWAGAAIVGDAVVFAGDSGEVISHHLTQDIVFDRYLLGDTKVRANISYIDADKAILVGTQDTQTLFKIKMKEDGSFQKNMIQKVNVKGDITGGISNYNGRAYVPSGGMYANGLSVVDTETMQVAYRNTDVGSQSYPLVSNAYATSENNQEVKIYVIDYSSGDLRVLSDAQSQTTSKMETLAKGYGTYNSGSVTPDAYGNLYICGASFSGGGPLYSIQSRDARFSITDMENAIANFPVNFTYDDKKAFQLLLNTYLFMSEGEQKQVQNASLLLDYEIKMQKLSDEKLSRIQSVIDNLPEVITIENQESIRSAHKEYGELLESDQLRIQNYEALTLADEQLQALLQGVAQLRSDIDVIDLAKLSLSDQVYINTLLARYEKLSASEQQLITNYDKLQNAQKILKRLADSLEIPSLNVQVEDILKVESLTLDNEAQILSLYSVIMNIDEEVRVQIKGYEQFLEAYNGMIQQRKIVDEVSNAIWTQIQPLNIQMSDHDAILKLYAQYVQLSEKNKEYVSYVEDLEYAKVVIDKMDKGYLGKELFEKIKIANTRYSFETNYDDMHLEFTFEGKDITQPSDFAFHVGSTSLDDGAIYSLVKNAQILSFAHNGNFPGKAELRMDTKLSDGVYQLYYYNPMTKSAELVQDIEVIKGSTSFTLTHASTYFITSEHIDPLKSAQVLTTPTVNTGDGTSITWIWMSVITSFGVLILLSRKQKIK